jgi:hypothetical protein
MRPGKAARPGCSCRTGRSPRLTGPARGRPVPARPGHRSSFQNVHPTNAHLVQVGDDRVGDRGNGRPARQCRERPFPGRSGTNTSYSASSRGRRAVKSSWVLPMPCSRSNGSPALARSQKSLGVIGVRITRTTMSSTGSRVDHSHSEHYVTSICTSLKADDTKDPRQSVDASETGSDVFIVRRGRFVKQGVRSGGVARRTPAPLERSTTATSGCSGRRRSTRRQDPRNIIGFLAPTPTVLPTCASSPDRCPTSPTTRRAQVERASRQRYPPRSSVCGGTRGAVVDACSGNLHGETRL